MLSGTGNAAAQIGLSGLAVSAAGSGAHQGLAALERRATEGESGGSHQGMAENPTPSGRP